MNMEPTVNTLTEAHLMAFRDFVDSKKTDIIPTDLLTLEVYMDQIERITRRVIKLCEKKEPRMALKRGGMPTGEEPQLLRQRRQEIGCVEYISS